MPRMFMKERQCTSRAQFVTCDSAEAAKLARRVRPRGMGSPLDSCVSRIQVAAAPFVQDKQRPRARPRSASREKILTDGSDTTHMKHAGQCGTTLRGAGLHARWVRPPQPMPTVKGGGAFGLRENLG